MKLCVGIIFISITSMCLLSSCCQLRQEHIYEAALLYYLTQSNHIVEQSHTVNKVKVINVRKYSCDSLSAYVRVMGTYTESSGMSSISGIKFDKASSLTMVRKGEKYVVNKESVEE